MHGCFTRCYILVMKLTWFRSICSRNPDSNVSVVVAPIQTGFGNLLPCESDVNNETDVYYVADFGLACRIEWELVIGDLLLFSKPRFTMSAHLAFACLVGLVRCGDWPVELIAFSSNNSVSLVGFGCWQPIRVSYLSCTRVGRLLFTILKGSAVSTCRLPPVQQLGSSW